MIKIFDLTLEPLTPASIGSTNPNQADELFRITSLRGPIEWWARTLAGGAAVDMNLNEIQVSVAVQRLIFGSTQASSKVKLLLKELNITQINPHILVQRNKVKHIRLQLLSFRKKNIPNFLNNLLKAYRRVVVSGYFTSLLEKDKLAKLSMQFFVCSTLLAILFGGIGKASRRGLGNFTIESINFSKEFIDNDTFEIHKIFSTPPTNFDGSALKSLLEKCYNVSKDLVTELNNRLNNKFEERKRNTMPQIPSLSKRFSSIYLLKLPPPKTQSPSIEQNLVNLNDFLEELFLRTYRGQGLVRILQRLQNLGRGRTIATQIGSYILGLPRHAKATERVHYLGIDFNPHTSRGQKTPNQYRLGGKLVKKVKGKRVINSRSGYIEPVLKGGKVVDYRDYRRASPVIVKMHNQNYALISIFESSDWQDKLYWWTSRNRPRNILNLRQAYNEVKKYVSNLVNKTPNSSKIWP